MEVRPGRDDDAVELVLAHHREAIAVGALASEAFAPVASDLEPGVATRDDRYRRRGGGSRAVSPGDRAATHDPESKRRHAH
jgi:hypothetical protein